MGTLIIRLWLSNIGRGPLLSRGLMPSPLPIVLSIGCIGTRTFLAYLASCFMEMMTPRRRLFPKVDDFLIEERLQQI